MNIQEECNALGYNLTRNGKDDAMRRTFAYKTTPQNSMGGVGYFTSRDVLLRWIEQVKEIRAIFDSLPPIELSAPPAA